MTKLSTTKHWAPKIQAVIPMAKKNARHITGIAPSKRSGIKSQLQPVIGLSTPVTTGLQLFASSWYLRHERQDQAVYAGISRQLFAHLLIWWLVGQTWLLAAEPSPAASSLREKFGLVLVKSQIWVLEDEIEARRLLGEISLLSDEIIQLEKQLTTSREKNAQAWREISLTVATLQAELAQTPTGSPQRPVLEQRLQELRSLAVLPQEFGGQPEARAKLIQLSRRRATFIVRVLTLEQLFNPLSERYAKLAKEPAVAQSITTVAGSRLGPQRPLTGDAKHLAELKRLAMVPAVPLYLQSGRHRVTILLSEQMPATVSLSEETAAVSYFSAHSLELAGIDIPADSPVLEQTVAPGRRLKVRQVKLPAVRIGSYVARDVPVFVLPPEGDDLGNQLSSSSFSTKIWRLEPQNVRLVLELQ